MVKKFGSIYLGQIKTAESQSQYKWGVLVPETGQNQQISKEKIS